MRLIDADAIKYREKMECCGHGDYRQLLYVTDDDIAEMPTIDPESVRPVGHWIWYEVSGGRKRCKCSECGESHGSMETPCCPNCGVRMEGVE